MYAQIETAAGTSKPINNGPGFRQGGRYSTTAGRTSVRRIMSFIRRRCTGVGWGRLEVMEDMEFADDITLFAESTEVNEHARGIAKETTTGCGTGIEYGTEVRVFGSPAAEWEVR